MRASAWVMAARFLTVVAGFATWALVARWYGQQALGLVALINSAAALFSIITVFGLGVYLMRELSASNVRVDTEQKFVLFRLSTINVLVLVTLLSGPAIWALSMRLPEFSKQTAVVTYAIIGIALLGRSLIGLNVNAVRALASAQIYALFLLLPSFVNFTIVAIWLVISEPVPLVPIIALAVGTFSTGIAAFIFTLVRLYPRTSYNYSAGEPRSAKQPIPKHKNLFQLGLPFFFSAASAMLMSEGNIVVAGFLLPIDNLGVYSVAIRISMVAAFFYSSTNLVVSPHFSRLKTLGDHNMLKNYAKNASAITFLSSVPILVFLFVGGKWVIIAAFGDEFADAWPLLVILLLGQAINVYTGLTNNYLSMTGGQVILSWIFGLAACVNIALTIVLTPYFGMLGPAIAMSVSIAVCNATALIAIRQRNGFWLCYLPSIRRTGQ
ncbi:MAG: oligosaccharide flippase family protein [Tateyamaria sp.]|nr:oligosaccharide flippase family protein [Tateyamaria sp.]